MKVWESFVWFSFDLVRDYWKVPVDAWIKFYLDVDIEMEIESGIATHNLVRSWHGCQPLVRDTFLDEEYVWKFWVKIMSQKIRNFNY